MKLLALLLPLLASSASAQVLLNEIYVSHSGVDDQEYVELVAPAGFDLTNHLVLVVEGEPTGPGLLDQAWDLTPLAVPDDGGGIGFVVLGNTGVATKDLDIGPDNVLENGTETFFLVRATDRATTAAILAAVGTDLDPDGDCVIALPAGTVVLDRVAMVGDTFPAADVVFDGAPPLGPDGTFIPAGVFREPDGGPWCVDTWLDFDDVPNFDQPRTPGAANTAACDATRPGTPLCFGIACPCANDDPTAGCANSTGTGGTLSGVGSRSVAADDLVLGAASLPPNNSGLFYMGDKAVKNPFQDGFQCALGVTLRFLADVQSSGPSGTMTLGPGIVAKSGGLIVPGTTWYFHAWHRDAPGSPCGTGSNLTHAYAVSYVP